MPVRLRFRAPVHAELLQNLAAQSQTAELVEILPPVSYREALQEMMRADGLLVMQGKTATSRSLPSSTSTCARGAYLGLADPRGDTGKTMRGAGVEHVAALEDADGVEHALAAFLDALSHGAAPVPILSDMSRSARTKALAGLLEIVRVEHRALTL